VGDDLTFGNRFDDAEGRFRVLYAASSPLACYLETLARYRRPPDSEQLLSALAAIKNARDDYTPPATVPAIAHSIFSFGMPNAPSKTQKPTPSQPTTTKAQPASSKNSARTPISENNSLNAPKSI
jgi:hypothetical protein